MRCVFAVLAVLVPVARLSGQTLELRVVEEGTGRPLAGVVIRLEQGGRTVVMGLSAENGRLVLRAPAPGAYQLRAGRIGFESPALLGLTLGTAPLTQVVEMPRAARMLPTLSVSGATRCRTTGSGLPAALWEEVQLALTANRITVEQRLQVVHAVRYERDLSASRQLLRERLTGSLITSGQPFVALPAGQLARQGYVSTAGDSVQYSAPDAAVLLADEFVQTHCFTVRQAGPTPELVGLAFDPVPGRNRADVAGTLWIDRESRELRFLDYHYTGVPGPAGLGEPGGQIHFRRLPTGTWIVREWVIRMPRTAERRTGLPGTDPWVITGWMEHGGRASVTPPRLPNADLRSVIEGEVYDSLHRTGLAGVLVSVDGEPDTARTDRSGRFRLTIAGRGPRLVRARHPLLGLVSDNSTQEVELHPARASPMRIAVPPPARFAATFCPAGGAGARVLGMVADSAGRPVEQARVRATWFQSIDELDRKGAVTRSLVVESGARGLFAFCELPAGWLIRIELLGERHAVLHGVQVRSSEREALWVDLKTRTGEDGRE